MIKVKSKKSGLTLIEVVVSIAILSIVITPMLSIVFSNVKTNKNAEDKQQALAIAQKYVEEFKSEDIVKAATDTEFKDVPGFSGFQYKQSVTELDYKFSDKKDEVKDKPKFKDIRYDAKVVVDSNENNILIDIKGKDDSISVGNTSFDKSSSDKMPLEIINGKDKDDKANDNKVTIKINRKAYDVDKQIDNAGKKSGYLIIQFKGTVDNNIQNNLPKIVVHASNYCNDEFTIYFANEVIPKINYYFENDKGVVKVYSNILVSSENYQNNSRVYKIQVQVKKTGDDKSLQEIVAYKNVAE